MTETFMLHWDGEKWVGFDSASEAWLPPRKRTELPSTESRPSTNLESICLSTQNVGEIEQRLMSLPPMTLETDKVLAAYFMYLTTHLKKIGSPFPFDFYDCHVTEQNELRRAYDRMSRKIPEIIGARGRGHTGQLGDYFWETSKVPNMLGIYKDLVSAMDVAYKKLHN